VSQKAPVPLCQSVRGSLKRYFRDLNGEEPVNLHGMVMSEVEKPLLELVMERAQSNQTRAARMLGINRNTLRKKLKFYNLE
jgi:Fis family transcriptional regulator